MDVRGMASVRQLVGGGGLVVDPPMVVLPSILDAVAEASSVLRVLLSPRIGERVSADFRLESRLAGAEARGELRLREASRQCEDRLFIGDGTVGLFVSVQQQARLLPVENEPLGSRLRERYETAWSDAGGFSTRAPPRQQMYEAAAEHLPDPFADEFQRALEGASRLEWRGTPAPVELALVVAARAEAHHHDICEWAEVVELSSRSTVARTKQSLAEAGVIAIRRVPQDWGRPRQRLVVAEAAVAAARVDAANLVSRLRQLAS